MRYICQLCGYVYDDARESVPFAELPDGWTCPLCKAPKSLFKPEIPVVEDADTVASEAAGAAVVAAAGEAPAAGAAAAGEAPAAEAAEAAGVKTAIGADGDVLAGLSAGQLAALCGNLARGCEKQDRIEESGLFAQLADVFAAAMAPVEGADVESLSDLLLGDAQRYAAARESATAAGDRGALRVITWGERVTNMLTYLVGRYLDEGESFLEGTEVWVCTVCGFVYVGDEAPELCPVCKVPAWKFEKMERRAS